MPRVGFETTIAVLELAMTVHALHRALTVIIFAHKHLLYNLSKVEPNRYHARREMASGS
jgi:hypothetical protein